MWWCWGKVLYCVFCLRCRTLCLWGKTQTFCAFSPKTPSTCPKNRGLLVWHEPIKHFSRSLQSLIPAVHFFPTDSGLGPTILGSSPAPTVIRGIQFQLSSSREFGE